MKRPPGQPIRVLIAEDSRAQRELMSALVRGAAMEVLAAVGDGRAAVAAAARLRPDVIVMDIAMPYLDGFEATRQIMQSCPAPIVLVSSAEDAQQRLIAALAAGALTVLRKPGGANTPAQMVERASFITTVRLMADVLVVTRRSERAPALGAPASLRGAVADAPQVLAVAASTGGPAALQTVLSGLGAGFPLPILVVQHIAGGFVAPLVEWLQSVTSLPVGLAKPTEPLRAGHAYLAPENQHLGMVVRNYAALSPPRASDRYCPSADTLFEGVAHTYGRAAIGVIMTGMGDDGARGLQALRVAGGRTLAQDEASCVVYGMPKAAIAAGAAERVVSLSGMAQAIRDLL